MGEGLAVMHGHTCAFGAGVARTCVCVSVHASMCPSRTGHVALADGAVDGQKALGVEVPVGEAHAGTVQVHP